MIRLERVNAERYDVQVGGLNHSLGSVDLDIDGCYSFKPAHPGRWSAAFLKIMAAHLDKLNEPREAQIRATMQEEN